MTIDHIVPRSKGGEDSWENLITACPACNTKKGNRTLAEAEITALKQPTRPNHLLFLQQWIATVYDEWKPYLFMS